MAGSFLGKYKSVYAMKVLAFSLTERLTSAPQQLMI
jgi:hypothetical protein